MGTAVVWKGDGRALKGNDPMNDYEARKQARIDRYRERAERAQERSQQRQAASDAAVEGIPPGQPILVGHHSERAHRRALDRSHQNMRKAIEEQNKADYWADRAAAAEHNTAISSDDPDAITKLKERLAAREAAQATMKHRNKIIRRKKLTDEKKSAALVEDGLSEIQARRLLEPDSINREGYPPYSLQNNNAEIRRLKKRIAALEVQAGRETTQEQVGVVKIVRNVEENRLQIFFPGKPDDAIRTALKQHRFRWSRYQGCWQRHLNANGEYALRCVLPIIREGYE